MQDKLVHSKAISQHLLQVTNYSTAWFSLAILGKIQSSVNIWFSSFVISWSMERQLSDLVSSYVESVKSVVEECSKMAEVICRSNQRTVRHYSYNHNKGRDNGAKNQAMMQMYMQEQSTRPQTRVKSTRGPQNRSQSRATSRPHTVATTRTHKTHYYYGKPPPKEAHAAVLNLSRTQEIKAPIIERRLRSRESTKTEDAKQPHISVLQPYPMNYNTFLVQTLFKDMSKLYPDPDNIIKSGVEGEEVLVEDGGVQVVDSRFCWKMTWNDTVYQWNAIYACIYHGLWVIIRFVKYLKMNE